MERIWTQAEVQSLYRLCGPPVFRFSRFFFGEDLPAEEAVRRAFIAYLRATESPSLQTPARELLRRVWMEMRSACNQSAVVVRPDTGLEGAILSVPCDARAVFILRNVLGLDSRETAWVLGMPAADISRLHLDAMLQIRRLWSSNRENRERK